MNIFDGNSGLSTAIALIAFAIVFQACSPSKVMGIYTSWIVAGMKSHQRTIFGHGEYGKRKPVHTNKLSFAVVHPFACAIAILVLVANPFNAAIFCCGIVDNLQPVKNRIGSKQLAFHVRFPCVIGASSLSVPLYKKTLLHCN